MKSHEDGSLSTVLEERLHVDLVVGHIDPRCTRVPTWYELSRVKGAEIHTKKVFITNTASQ